MVRRYALGSGLDVISCPSPLFPDEAPRHLIIPDISLGILTSDSLNRLDMPGCVKARSSRFTDNAKLKEFKQRISFSLRTVNELLDEAIISLRDALSTHDELEKLYIEAIDFDKVDEETKKITAVFKAAVS
ncbi:MAG: hypothetical protein K6F09_04580 [Clostridiales bacterium]|nr:hypothetical protein [Clostridiales bacterium]